MSIEVKCNKCGSTYSVTDKLAGGSVRCAKCKAPIHVPIVRQPPAPVRAATPAEAVANADLSFDYAPGSTPAAATASAPPAPPPPRKEINLVAADAADAPPASAPAPAPRPPAPSSPPATTGNVDLLASAGIAEPSPDNKAAAATRPRKGRSGNLKISLAWLGTSDFDFRFRSYFSGNLARALWIIAICAAAYLAYSATRLWLNAGELPEELRSAARWLAFTQVFFALAGLAMFRIALETISALFNIAKLLREVRDELRQRN